MSGGIIIITLINKHKILALLAIVFAIGIAVTALFIGGQGKLNGAKAVEFELVNKNDADGFVSQAVVDSIMDLDYVVDSYKEGTSNTYKINVIDISHSTYTPPVFSSNELSVLTVEDENAFLSGIGKEIKFTYTGANRINWDFTTDPVAIIPKSIYESCGITSFNRYRYNCDVYCELSDGYSCILDLLIMGYYEGEINGETPILIPTSSYKATMKANTVNPEKEMVYPLARFTIDPTMNQNLKKVREDIKRILEENNYDSSKINVVFS